MKFISEGIAVFDDIYLRNEELIDYANGRTEWREGTVGGNSNPNVRITDILELEPNRTELETELHKELVDTYLAAINEYGIKFPQLRITVGEKFRVARYQQGGFYKQHIDSGGNRILSGVLYLNSDIEGGRLRFPAQNLEIEPKAGRLVLFPSNFVHIHESLPVEKGIKYAVLSWFGIK